MFSSRRFLELTTKPFSVFNSLLRGQTLPYQRTLNLSLERTSNDSGRSNNNNSEEQTNNEQKYNYSYSSASSFQFATIFPLFAIMTHKLNSEVSCFFGGSGKTKDRLEKRISLIQYPSNNPIEDRWAVYQLETIPGFVTMVFDGHGGWQAADYAKDNLPKEIENALKENKNKTFENHDAYITASLQQAFDKVEEGFLNIAREAYKIGFAGPGKVGACALVTIVHGNKVYAANAGDCKGVIAKEENGKYTIRKVNHKLNANSKKEQARLKKQFTDDDIVVCKRGDASACYVKNRLQPTRAFGDFGLKHADFNNPKGLSFDHGYRMKIDNFKGPYITHVPEIQVFELDKKDKYLILSSDGMWDELNKKDVQNICEKYAGDTQNLTSGLLNGAIQVAAKKIDMSEAQLRSIPVGQRRNYHDDMTIVVVDLENQV